MAGNKPENCLETQRDEGKVNTVTEEKDKEDKTTEALQAVKAEQSATKNNLTELEKDPNHIDVIVF